jgi:hypothetical protein
VVTDLLAYLGWDGETGADRLNSVRSNTGLPGDVLRLMQRHQSLLRPGPHDSEIDFVLERCLGRRGDPTPWVLSREQIEFLIEHYRAPNLGLMSLMDMQDPAQARRMRADDRWWRPYDPPRPVEPPEAPPAECTKTDLILAESYRALFERERESVIRRRHTATDDA